MTEQKHDDARGASTSDAVLAVVIGGTFIGAWAWGVTSGNPWPVIVWFATAITVVAAGG